LGHYVLRIRRPKALIFRPSKKKPYPGRKTGKCKTDARMPLKKKNFESAGDSLRTRLAPKKREGRRVSLEAKKEKNEHVPPDLNPLQ